MQNFGTKADDTAGPSGQLSAAEFNNLATELENAVLNSGQPLDSASVIQLAKSLFLHGVKSQTFQDSGAANAYILTPVSGASGVTLPADYSAMDGAVIMFRAANANTGASTINIGQTNGALLGAKAVVDEAGAAITAAAITSSKYAQLRYDASIGAGSWVLLPSSRAVATSTQSQQLSSNNVLITPLALNNAFKGANQSLIASGFQILPGGLILQWGVVVVPISSGAGSATFPLPMTFPSTFISSVAQFTILLGGLGGRTGTSNIGTNQIQVDVAGVGASNSSQVVKYWAWGV